VVGESDESDDEILCDLVPIPRDLSRSAMGVIHEEKEGLEEDSARGAVEGRSKGEEGTPEDEKMKFLRSSTSGSGAREKGRQGPPAGGVKGSATELELKKKKAKAEFEEQRYREEMREFRRRRKEILERYPEEDLVEIPPQEGFTLPMTPAEKEKREQQQQRRRSRRRGQVGGPGAGEGRSPEDHGAEEDGAEEGEGYEIIRGRRRRKVYDGNVGPSPEERARSINWMAHREPNRGETGRYLSPMSPEWQWSEHAT
jgi:hypothetical protein